MSRRCRKKYLKKNYPEIVILNGKLTNFHQFKLFSSSRFVSTNLVKLQGETEAKLEKK